ncbi:MAG: 4-(cytidine 5'-diphospho)-2-C-methyl-D-erythritol kinase [Clostridia bacterium]|nr:4-(cytidine 5'-diphospho)-2-C-methyl-D-erythritol kinase [Clostridia bacterium]
MKKLYWRAYAKINLTLDVLGLLENGYHSVEMVMQQVSLYDLVSISKASSGIYLTCSLPFLPCNADNLAYRAAEAFFAEAKMHTGAKIHIQKHIPVGAGLAGGSSDAAAVLCGLNKLYGDVFSQSELCDIGTKIGADVPFCICGGTCLARGIGERLTPVPKMPDCHIVLLKPAFSISTAWAYEKIDKCSIVHPDTARFLDELEKQNLRAMCSAMGNVLEQVSAMQYPLISEAKKDLLRLGALGAIMSGSGPTVFGVFESGADAQKAKSGLWGRYKTAYTCVPI